MLIICVNTDVNDNDIDDDDDVDEDNNNDDNDNRCRLRFSVRNLLSISLAKLKDTLLFLLDYSSQSSFQVLDLTQDRKVTIFSQFVLA